MSSWTRRIALVFLLAAAVGAAHCSGSSTTTGTPAPGSTASSAASRTASPAASTPLLTTPGTSTGTAYQQYSAQVANVNACHDSVYAQLNELSPADTGDAIPLIGQWITCLQTFQTALSQIPFPSSVSSQVSALAAADQKWIAALQDLVANPSNATKQAAADAGDASAAAAANLHVVFH